MDKFDLKDWGLGIVGAGGLFVLLKDIFKSLIDKYKSPRRTRVDLQKTEAEANSLLVQASANAIQTTMKIAAQLETENLKMKTENDSLKLRIEELVKQFNGIKDELIEKDRRIEEQAKLIASLQREVKKLKG